MSYQLFTQHTTDPLSKTLSTVYPDTAPAMSYETPPCGLVFLLEGESEAIFLKDIWFTQMFEASYRYT
jgi:hypothetical protein